MDGVFKFQHLARGRSDVRVYHSPGEEENKYQEAGWRQVEASGRKAAEEEKEAKILNEETERSAPWPQDGIQRNITNESDLISHQGCINSMAH